MSVIGTKARLGRRLLGAALIVVSLSSCSYFGSFGAHVKSAFGIGDCQGPTTAQMAQPVAGSDGAAGEGGHVVLYSPNQDAKRTGMGCWLAGPSKSQRTVDMTQANSNAVIVTSAVQTDVLQVPDETNAPLVMETQNASVSLPDYLGAETVRLDDDFVEITVQLSGDVARQDIATYAECAAAQYTLGRGYSFVRHVLTSVKEKKGIWTGKSVYWVSEALPRGLMTIDAAVTAQACFENGIPTL